jgi:CopG antitoxin of type II toxin-antitoxin system
MAKNKSSISNASSYTEIGEYWDTHDLADHWEQTHEVNFDVSLESAVLYFALEKTLAEKLRAAAKNHGVSPETLLNVWVQEHVVAEQSSK